MNIENKSYIFFEINPEHKILIKDIFKHKNTKSKIILATNSDDIEKEKTFINKYEIKTYKYDGNLLEFSQKDTKNIFEGDLLDFFCLSKNADRNLSIFSYIANQTKKLNIPLAKAKVYISPDWSDVEEFLQNIQNKIYKNIDVKLININRLASQILATKYQPIDFISIDKKTLLASAKYKVALIGCSLLSLETMFKMYHQSAIEGINFELSIIDKAAAYNAKRISQLYTGFVKDITLKSKTVLSYIDEINLDSIKDVDLAIIDVGDDKQNFEIAKKIQDLLIENNIDTTTIAPYISTPADIIKDDDFNPCIINFGDDKEIFTKEVIISEKFMNSGKLVNDKYNQLKSDSNKINSWLAMTDFEKGSNTSVADFNNNFIKILGTDIFATIINNKDFQDYLDRNPIKEENLARSEHRRWMAYHFSRGWGVMPLEDEVMTANKDMKKKLHVCLVEYDNLDAPSEAFGEPYKQYDKDNVRLIYDIYQILHK